MGEHNQQDVKVTVDGVEQNATCTEVKIIQVGQEDTYVKVNSVEDVLKLVGGTGRRVTSRGEDLTKVPGDTPMPEGAVVTVAPVAVKQGR